MILATPQRKLNVCKFDESILANCVLIYSVYMESDHVVAEAKLLRLCEVTSHPANCLHWAHFETMKAEEQAMEGGYVESTISGNFFRKGEVGDGSKTVAKTIQDEILDKYEELLKSLGYA